MLDITINENIRSEHFRMANFTVPIFIGTEQNGKNAFILAPTKVVERLEWFSMCSVNAVLIWKTYPVTFILGSELYLSVPHRECYRTLR